MKAKVLDSFTPANEGKTLSNFADTTASAQVRYQATPKFGFGTAVKYESKKYAGQPDSAAALMQRAVIRSRYRPTRCGTCLPTTASTSRPSCA
jgi:hypothetical protein